MAEEEREITITKSAERFSEWEATSVSYGKSLRVKFRGEEEMTLELIIERRKIAAVFFTAVAHFSSLAAAILPAFA